MSTRTIGARFGLSRRRLTALGATLRRDGITVTGTYPQRTALTVSASAQTIDRVLAVGLGTYRDGSGHRWHAPLGTPRIPPGLRGTVTAVTGLSTEPVWRAADVPGGGLNPRSLPIAYDIAPLHQLGLDGQGMTIAIISFSAFNSSDPAAFAQQFGIDGPTPQVVPVDGATTDDSGAIETDLDIDTVRAAAPDAQVLVYEAPQSSSAYADTINRIVGDHRASIITSSWGQCELSVSGAERSADTAALRAAVAAGVTLFVATGDAGAYDCQRADLADHTLSVDWPASSADAVAVGGTRLNLDANDTYLSERGWEGVLSDSGGGGGFTTGDARPSWQRAPGMSRFPRAKRALPDVSAAADPGTGWLIYADGSFQEVGGTSAATPFWATSMLLIAQYAATQHVGRLGFVDPALYALASASQPYPPFHDVTAGGNRYYPAGPGWDPATGLGSPDVWNLGRDLVAYLKRHPSG